MNILTEADRLTNNDRQDIYSHPYEDFGRATSLYQPILDSNLDPRLKHPLIMIQVKIARLLSTPDHIDSMVDIAGYINTYYMVLEKLKSTTDKSAPK